MPLVCLAQDKLIIGTRTAITGNLNISVPLRLAETEQSFKTPENYSKYFIKRHVFDEMQYLYERYLDGKISIDSIEKVARKRKLSYQVNKKTRNSIYVFIGQKKDSTINIIIDLNCNKNFKDDSVLLYVPQKIYPFSIALENVYKNKIIKRSYPLELKVDINNRKFEKGMSDDFSVLVRPLNSKTGKFEIDKHKFSFEIFTSNIKSINDMNSLVVNFSEPDSGLKKIDFREIILYNPQTDTIITGEYQFKFKYISLANDKTVIEFKKLSEEMKGYKEGYILPEFSLDIIQDSFLVPINLKSLLGGHKYLLLDFWGTWCVPCIKNFPKLKDIETSYGSLGLKTVGIACEYVKDFNLVKKILSANNISWQNAFIEKEIETKQNIAGFMNIDSYPTYVLLDENMKIVIRHSGADGLDKIKEFLLHNLTPINK